MILHNIEQWNTCGQHILEFSNFSTWQVFERKVWKKKALLLQQESLLVCVVILRYRRTLGCKRGCWPWWTWNGHLTEGSGSTLLPFLHDASAWWRAPRFRDLQSRYIPSTRICHSKRLSSTCQAVFLYFPCFRLWKERVLLAKFMPTPSFWWGFHQNFFSKTQVLKELQPDDKYLDKICEQSCSYIRLFLSTLIYQRIRENA